MFGLYTIRKVLEVSCVLKKCFKLSIKNASFLSAAKTSLDRRYMIVDIGNYEDDLKIKEFKYPLVWLRDNCQCSNCFHAQSKSRIIDWTKFKFENAQPKSILIDKDLEVTWQDDHVSKFDLEWLRARNFTAENRKNYLDTHYRPKSELWSKDQFDLKSFQAPDIFENNEVLYRWLNTLTRYGVAVIKNAQLTEDQCKKLTDRIGFIRETHYGKEYAVRADPNAKNVAYTSNPLQFHTDLPYYDYTPGVTLLHCISQTQSPGAFNLLVDGFFVAKRLKHENSRAFECLSMTLVNWCDYGDDAGSKFEKINRSPVICLDYDGNVTRLNHSIPQRDTFFSIDIEEVNEWYTALRVFIDLLYEEAVYFKTEPGDILAFSNTRLLHGRTGYEDKEGNIRHLMGAYIDWDEIYSRLRVLANEKRAKN